MTKELSSCTDLAVYDIEVWSNAFMMTVMFVKTDTVFQFEISERRNTWDKFKLLIKYMKQERIEMCGWNSVLYDYIVLHEMLLLSDSELTVSRIKEINDRVIATKNTWFIAYYGTQQVIPQWDLYLIGHYNNRRASLKWIEVWQRKQNISETPHDFHKPIPLEGLDEGLQYNLDDVVATRDLLLYMWDDIVLRDEFMLKHKGDARRFNSGRMGEQIFLEILGWDACYKMVGNVKQPRQTVRESVALAPLVLVEHDFKIPAFAAIKQFFSEQVVVGSRDVFALTDANTPKYLKPYLNKHYTQTQLNKLEAKRIYSETGSLEKDDYPPRVMTYVRNLHKGVDVSAQTEPTIKGLEVLVDGIVYKNGVGGLHGCRQGSYKSGNGSTIVDLDYKGFYPAIAEYYDLCPMHLSRKKVGEAIAFGRHLRATYPKGSAGYELGKQMLNLMYGNSGNEHSFFYDLAYMFATCINGQLSLYYIIELLDHLTEYVIQANTDGITIMVKDENLAEMRRLIEDYNGEVLIVEEEIYERLDMRDVNNYFAVYKGGKHKLKGNYEIDRLPYKDSSSLIVQKAVIAFAMDDVPIEETVHGCKDVFDFLLATRVRGSDKLWIGDDYKHDGKVLRYYVSINGNKLYKLTPAGKRTGINTKYIVTEAQNAPSRVPWDIDYQFYIDQCHKLLEFTEV